MAEEKVIFEVEELRSVLRQDLPDGLRMLAAALESEQVRGWVGRMHVHGMGCRADEMGLDVTVSLRVPMVTVRSAVPELEG